MVMAATHACKATVMKSGITYASLKRAVTKAPTGGTMDGAINGSYSKERAEFADYPVNIYGEPDPSKRMHRSAYALYRVKGGSVGFDGKQLVNAGGVIAAPTGYSVIGQLKQLNAKIDDSVSATSEILKKVVDGQVLAGALIAAEGDDLLRKNPELQAKIERVMPLLSERPYFTLLSKQFTAKYTRFSREFWRSEGKVRTSAEFQKRILELQLIAE